MDVKYQTTWNFFFFFSKTINTLFHFPTRKIGNFNFHSPYSYFVFFSNVGYHSHYLSKPPAAAINSRGPKKKTHTTPLKYSATSVCQLLGSLTFFSKWHFVFLKKKTYHEVHKKRTEQDTLPFFLFICFCSFFFLYICMYFSLFVFCSFVLWHSWLFSFFSLLLQFCVSNIRYSIPEILGPTYVEKRKISYFVLARYLIQHWISPNQDDISYSARTFISG